MQEPRTYRVYVASNAHIDPEWLWGLDEALGFCRETFTRVLDLMSRHPCLIFIQGSSVYYEALEKSSPRLADRIKELVEKGGWRVTASFIEFDANMPLGESLVRHLLLGSLYFEERLGARPTTLWLPDSFGFPASLPQLVIKSGLRYFATSKLRWNDTNEPRFTVFRWRSVDGSTVLALITPGSYDDRLTGIARILLNLKKQLESQPLGILMQLFGGGDHGGGPSEEEASRLEEWWSTPPGLIKIESGGFDEFFEQLEKNANIPLHSGPLYLEFHRGVYTTGSVIKRLNRINESLVLQAEALYTLLKTIYGEPYPAEFSEIWRDILLGQGHDALSATVSREVYEEIVGRGVSVFRGLLEFLRRGLIVLSEKSGGGLIVFNPNSWPASPYLRLSGEEGLEGQRLSDGSILVFVDDLPPLGYRSFQRLGGDPRDRASVRMDNEDYVLENRFLRVRVSGRSGWITSLLIKDDGWEALGGPLRLRIYWDYPVPGRGDEAPACIFDAWELYHRDWPNRLFHMDLRARRIRVGERGPLYASVVAEYTYRQFPHASRLVLEAGLYAGKPYLELVFKADWRARHRLLKLLVPVSVNSSMARYEAPYGVGIVVDPAKTRDPRWRAMYEAPMQRWVDVSDNTRGVAVINDSKYGFSWINGELGVSLLRAPRYPSRRIYENFIEEGGRAREEMRDYLLSRLGRWRRLALHSLMLARIMWGIFRRPGGSPFMDQGYHEARIWIYPHRGIYSDAGVPRLAAELNTRFVAAGTRGSGGAQASLLRAVPDSPVHVTGVKSSDRVKGALVVRLYNTAGNEAEAVLEAGFGVKEAWEADLMERPLRKLDVPGRPLRFKPFEVRTVLLLPARRGAGD